MDLAPLGGRCEHSAVAGPATLRSRASRALELLQKLLETTPRERVPCLLLHADSNMGKTQITAKFLRTHPKRFDDEQGVERRPVIAIQMPPTPDRSRFYSGFLFELGAPHNAGASLAVFERLTRELLRRMSSRILIVDEVHHLLAGTYREQRAALNLLKCLANDLKLSLVLVGTRDAVLALQTDAQMMSRFPPFERPQWAESDDFRRLLGAFERVLPLRKPSNLAQKDIAQYVLTLSAGLTGGVSKLLNDAAGIAIQTRSEGITLELLEHAAHRPG